MANKRNNFTQRTNKLNLPAPLVRAIIGDEKKKIADYSVTELIKPVRVAALEKRYSDKIEVDVADELFKLLGTAVHLVIANAARAMQETDIWKRIEEPLVHAYPLKDFSELTLTVSGQPDYLEFQDGILTLVDWKVTTIWSAIFGGKVEWEQQLNMYNALSVACGNPPARKLKNYLILRDWKMTDAIRDPKGYPPKAFAVMEWPAWEIEEAEELILSRVRAHFKGDSASDEGLPECTKEERWERSGTWALMRAGRKRAVRVFDEGEKLPAPSELSAGDELVHRPGSSPRCEHYCSAAPFCSQFRKMKETR